MAGKQYDFQIIANLMAGKGEAKKQLEKLKDFLEKNKISFNSLEITSPTPISQIPKDGGTKIKRGVICLGGDGTVSETLGYVLNNKLTVPIALIPTGTANIIAGTLGLNCKDNFDFLLGNNIRQISVGVVEYQNEKDYCESNKLVYCESNKLVYFLLGLGLGFEENFLRLTKEKFKSILGIFSYILAALSELLSLKKIPVIVQANEFQAKINVCLLTVLNLQPKILKHLPLFKDERIKTDDSVFNIYYVEYNGSIFGKNYLQALMGTLFFHLFGSKNFGLVKQIPGNDFTIDSPIRVGTQIDGELRGTLPVKIFLNDQKASFLVF